MKKLRFLIASPSYNHQTAGVMVLHELCDMLNRQGHEAAMVLFGGPGPCFQWAYSNQPGHYHTQHQRISLSTEDAAQSIRVFLEDGVVIYPDLIPDNPLNAKRVVRYLLYKNHSYVAQNSDEYVLSFSQVFHDAPNSYLFKTFLSEELNAQGSRHWEDRTLDMTYFGKGPNFTNCHLIPGTVALSRTWPEDKAQLGELLRQCRYFFTWDSVSQTNVDAVACGAIPVVLQDKQASREEMGRGELGPLPLLRLANLLDKTSVDGDIAAVNTCVDYMNQRIAHNQVTWPSRVNEFAHSANQFFHFI
jgi:hypothetical protein